MKAQSDGIDGAAGRPVRVHRLPRRITAPLSKAETRTSTRGFRVMRIRPIKPEFWEDEEIATWPEGTRLFYIGLWNIADDAGYFLARPVHIAADLYRYEPRARRERLVRDRLGFLIERGKVRRFPDCECAWMPSMKGHVRVGGTPAFTVRNRHQSHGVRPPTPEGVEVRPRAAVREGKEGLSEGGNGGDLTFTEKAAAAGAKL